MARTIISGQRDVLSKCAGLYVTLHKRSSESCGCDTASTLEMLKADLQHHQESVAALARTASNITQLVRLPDCISQGFVADPRKLSAILATRAEATLRATMASVQTGIQELQLQSRQTGDDTEQLLQATTRGHRDAAKIKILAQIATMFLPASLLAVSRLRQCHRYITNVDIVHFQLNHVQQFQQQCFKCWPVLCYYYSAAASHSVAPRISRKGLT